MMRSSLQPRYIKQAKWHDRYGTHFGYVIVPERNCTAQSPVVIRKLARELSEINGIAYSHPFETTSYKELAGFTIEKGARPAAAVHRVVDAFNIPYRYTASVRLAPTDAILQFECTLPPKTITLPSIPYRLHLSNEPLEMRAAVAALYTELEKRSIQPTHVSLEPRQFITRATSQPRWRADGEPAHERDYRLVFANEAPPDKLKNLRSTVFSISETHSTNRVVHMHLAFESNPLQFVAALEELAATSEIALERVTFNSQAFLPVRCQHRGAHRLA